MLFHRGPAEILAVNTCMKHLKPLRFIGLVSADTAPAVKIISVCTQTPAPFSRHGNAYRADAPHTLRTAGAGRRWWGRIESLPRSVYSSRPIILFFFLWLFIFSWPLPPLNTQRHSEIILFSSSSTARETPSSRGACGKLPFKKRVFANNLWH